MSNKRRALIAALILYSVLVFVLDLISPLGIEVWVLNLPVFLVPMLFRNTRMVVFAGLACSIMTLTGSVLSPPGSNPPSWDAINRGMGLATIWLMAYMAINTINRSRQLDEAISSLRLEMDQHGRTTRSLEQSEERIRLTVEGAGMGTYDVNVKSGTVYWSANHLRMLGYATNVDRETPIDMWLQVVYPDDQARIQEEREQALQNRSLYSVEYRIRRVDNTEIRWIKVFGRWYYDEKGQAVRFLGVSFDITPRKMLECQLLEITAETERQIGQELHDSVGQEITGLGLMSQTLSQRLPEASSEQRLAIRLVAGLNQLHKQIRALAHGLVPVEMEAKGLWAALDDLATSMREQSGVSIQFECPEWIEMPDHAISMELYRIAQEALSNALRHGRPRRIDLSILALPNGLRLRIRDDGVGIAEQTKDNKGLGIRIMEYRATLIGGVFRIKPAQEGGTVVTVTLPQRGSNQHKETGDVSTNKNSNRG
ncbi:MAG TPA: PAS domain-containing protein [Gemmataceae bacterium]|nr:PAS domain-containing protein [Gemmataceae bacterium]